MGVDSILVVIIKAMRLEEVTKRLGIDIVEKRTKGQVVGPPPERSWAEAEERQQKKLRGSDPWGRRKSKCVESWKPGKEVF